MIVANKRKELRMWELESDKIIAASIATKKKEELESQERKKKEYHAWLATSRAKNAASVKTKNEEIDRFIKETTESQSLECKLLVELCCACDDMAALPPLEDAEPSINEQQAIVARACCPCSISGPVKVQAKEDDP
jgi:hypothetical protein